MKEDPIVIVSIARTPVGNLMGQFSNVPAADLGAAAIKGALARASSPLASDAIDEVIMGCVLPAGQGQAPARQASIAAGLPLGVGATTINKMCGSGMKAVMLAHDLLLAGNSGDVMVAGGMENMTRAPYLLQKARGGYRFGHDTVYDHMQLDGLEDAYDKGRAMGCFADATAAKYDISREAQDEFAISSLQRAHTASGDGDFEKEIVPVIETTRKGEVTHSVDQLPSLDKLDKIPKLRPAFTPEGTVTAANASSISDGAAALVLMKRSEAEKRGLHPLATIVAHATQSQEPEWFTTAPVGAIKQVMEKANWQADDVDLFEINEAFAVVTLAAMKEHNLPHEKVNIHGGACALGHPIGASGARILVTLLAALEKYNLRRGVASLCIGGGEATAMAIHRVEDTCPIK